MGIARYSTIYYDSYERLVIYGNLIDVIHELARGSTFAVKHTETGELFEARREGSKWWLRPPVTDEPIIREPVAWARPLDNFMGVVSSPYGAEASASNCYRFERIGEYPPTEPDEPVKTQPVHPL